MQSFGKFIKTLREQKGEPLRKVAAYLDIDQAILSKIEHGHRKANRSQVIKLAEYFEADEKKMLTSWLSDRIMYELRDEEYAEEALKLAEEQVAYEKFEKTDRQAVIRKIEEYLSKDRRILKAWVFGSFARGDDHAGSDVDIMIEEDPESKFNYFDLGGIQYELEEVLQRKVDIGFASSLKEHVSDNIRNEARLIYEIS